MDICAEGALHGLEVVELLLPVVPRADFHSSSVTSPELSNSFVPESITDGGFKGVVGTVLGVFTNISIQRSLSK